MITMNSFPSTLVNVSKITESIGNLLSGRRIIGGIVNPENRVLAEHFGEYLGTPVVLTNSGTNALLISIEWGIKSAGDRPIRWLIHEYIYFSVASFLMTRNEPIEILRAEGDEVTLADSELPAWDGFTIVLLTSHNNKICRPPKQVLELADRWVIEDRCLVFGAHSDFTPDSVCYSFSNNKLLMAGEGGCISSPDLEFLEWAMYRTFNGIEFTNLNPAAMYLAQYKVAANGSPFKSSTTALSSLILKHQLIKIDDIKRVRRENYSKLSTLLSPHGIEAPAAPDAPLFFTLPLPAGGSFRKTQEFQISCLRAGVQTMIGVLPYMGFKSQEYRVKRFLSLPVHTELSDEDIEYMATIIVKHYENTRSKSV